MSQRSLNIQQVVQIVRRHKIIVGAFTVAGLLIGALYSVLYPPLVTSTALVVLPGKAPQIATEVVIAGSQPVLSHALPAIHPPMSLQAVENQLSVQTPAIGILSIKAKAKSAAQADAVANAVANSYIAYVQNPRSPAGHITAQLLQPAATSVGTGALTQDLLDGGLGALAGLVAGTVTAVVVGRRSGRLVVLDDIANSIAVPVLAAVSVANPSDAPGWARVLDEYEPRAVEAWRLRQALLELGVIGPTGPAQGTASVTMLSMPADRGALALGPQLATFAASLGISTLLVVGAQQDSGATAALYTACSVPERSPKRSPHLRTLVGGTSDAAVQAAERLVIVVAVAADEKLQSPETMPTATTVLGVSSGAATAEQLARLAMAATTHGREVAGLFVADPDPADRTNGRFPRSARHARRTPASGLSAPATAAQRASVPTETS
jgi:capsular polysaccharide biosynthesis protein